MRNEVVLIAEVALVTAQVVISLMTDGGITILVIVMV